MTARDAHCDVAIVGGGVAGLGLACALAQHGLEVVVLEARACAGGIHRGDSLLPKTVAILDHWGVLDGFYRAQAQQIAHLEVHHHVHGMIFEHPLAPPSERYPYLVLPHARIESVLEAEAERTGRVRLERRARAQALLRDDTGRVCGVRYRGEDGPHALRARLVVGCDGQTSGVRTQLGLGLERHAYDHAYLGLEAERPPQYQNAMRVHLHADGGVLLMPRPDRVGVGVLVEAGSGRHWLGLSDEALAAALVRRAPVLEGMRLYRDGAHVYALARAHAVRYTADGAVVIGDAAHCTNPTAGQGMAMALGDAAALARSVGPALVQGSRGLDAALARYEATQWPRNRALVASAHRLAVAYALRGRAWDRVKARGIAALGGMLRGPVSALLFRAFLESGGGGDGGGPSERPPTRAATPRASEA